MVTVKKKQSALSDRRAMLVRLEDYGSDGSWFCVNPFYKHRKTGDPVILGDRVLLTSVHTGQGLNVTQVHDGIRQGIVEVNALLDSPTGWHINLYLSNEDNQDTIIKGGDVIRFFHAENEQFLTCDEYHGRYHAFLRTTFRATASSATSSKALWEVDVSPHTKFRATYYSGLQDHAARTTCKIKISSHNENPVHLTVTDEASVDTLFELDPTTGTSDEDRPIPVGSFARLRHSQTQRWVCSSRVAIDEDRETRIMHKVSCKLDTYLRITHWTIFD
ncbi:Inositol 1 4 5-trisphosphate receptor [Fasciolopsis buskii]|uniref:Inositol 1 4 5-trisphosphate receptor n=1 Tax=Fasciolopsis buskii TaxID=27845 RepID=A0A8E0VKM0_9TREM|nr:Inositol 1 4 5-trisphosphate receptor [Fasciolopsis buski]